MKPLPAAAATTTTTTTMKLMVTFQRKLPPAFSVSLNMEAAKSSPFTEVQGGSNMTGTDCV
jgi:hypothetical protein